LKPLFDKNEQVYKTSTITVDVKTDLCKKYAARKITSITVSDSPAWLKEKLEVIGQRSINNVVDATNYVLFATGQPTHVFDSDKVSGGIE
ncbi:phenylalanine--tRNA ligase beta subunit-related protein, partial [Lacticaseibacillus paracasei]